MRALCRVWAPAPCREEEGVGIVLGLPLGARRDVELGGEERGDARPGAEQAAQHEHAVHELLRPREALGAHGQRRQRRAERGGLLVRQHGAELAQVDADVALVGEEEALDLVHHLLARRVQRAAQQQRGLARRQQRRARRLVEQHKEADHPPEQRPAHASAARDVLGAGEAADEALVERRRLRRRRPPEHDRHRGNQPRRREAAQEQAQLVLPPVVEEQVGAGLEAEVAVVDFGGEARRERCHLLAAVQPEHARVRVAPAHEAVGVAVGAVVALAAGQADGEDAGESRALDGLVRLGGKLALGRVALRLCRRHSLLGRRRRRPRRRDDGRRRRPLRRGPLGDAGAALGRRGGGRRHIGVERAQGTAAGGTAAHGHGLPDRADRHLRRRGI